jgi:hypothetical protein
MNAKPMVHGIQLNVWWDQKGHWLAKIKFTEKRNGKAYGAPVVDQLVSVNNADYYDFMELVRKRVKAKIDTFWT